MARTTNRHSSIDLMPQSIQDEIKHLRVDLKFKIDVILEHLRQLGLTASRSALGRHVKSIDELARIAREANEIVNAIGGPDASARSDKLAEVNNQFAHALIYRLQLAALNDESVTVSSAEVLNTTRALSSLSTQRKNETERLRKDRQEQKKESAETARTAATAAGLSKETVEQIYQAVLGVEA